MIALLLMSTLGLAASSPAPVPGNLFSAVFATSGNAGFANSDTVFATPGGPGTELLFPQYGVSVGRLDVTGFTLSKRIYSPVRWPEGGGPPDDVHEETWSCVGSKLVKKRVRNGKVVQRPAIEETVWNK